MTKKRKQSSKATKSSKRRKVAAQPEEEPDTATAFTPADASQATQVVAEGEISTVELQEPIATDTPFAPVTESGTAPKTRSETAKANIKEGLKQHALAGRAHPCRQAYCGETKRDCVKPLFTLGQVVATPGALAAIGVSGDDLSIYLARHQSGDWGDVDAHDRKENQLSLEQGFRLMSAYTLSITVAKIWIITEADRSSTCILLPEEY
jgi:hypothetical protein